MSSLRTRKMSVITSSEDHTNPAFVPDLDADKKIERTDNNDHRRKSVCSVELKNMEKFKESESNDTTYDPYKHRKVEHPTTNSETLFHLLKGSLGTGILAMPKAFSHSGWILGTAGTFVIGLICTYCIHMLIKVEYELCKRRKQASLTYPATAEAAFSEGPIFFRKFAPYSVHMVNAFLIVYQLGTCCVYVVFIATNVKSVCDMYMEKYNIALYMLIFLLPLILINWIKNLKFLAPFSTLANAVTFVSFAIIIYYVFQHHPTFDGKEAVGPISDWPLFFGTVLFALEAIGVIMPLENEMKKPKSFGGTFGVLNIGMITIIFLYVSMGLLGYLSYGKKVQGTITLDIPEHEILAQVVKITLAFAIFITYGLQCYVAVDIAWNEYLSKKLEKNPYQKYWEYAIRTVLVLITFLLAVAVPKLDLFISLFGALCLSALGISIPALVELFTYWYTTKGIRFYFLYCKNVALMLFGVLGLVIGTYTTLGKIIEEFSEGKK